jgi:hypothetical protein
VSNQTSWAALPGRVIAGVAERVGGVEAVPAGGGDHAEIAVTVTGADDAVFIKAAATEPGIRSLGQELLVGAVLDRELAPAPLWHFEAAGWLVAAFEYLDDPHADLSPGSHDLDLLAATLDLLGATRAPDLPLFTPTTRLGFADPATDGTTLVHTDLNPANLIATRHGLRIVDWAWATRAAPWVELALLAPWLIGAGHTPGQADQWLALQHHWASTGPDVLSDFAFRNAAKWAAKAARSSVGWVFDLAAWTGQWAAYHR